MLPDQEQIGDLLPVRGCGFGFTMTSRACLDKMWVACRKYRDPRRDGTRPKVADMFGQVYEFLQGDPSDLEDMTLMSEDFSFCKRWRDLGGTVQLYVKGGVLMHAGGHCWSAREMPGGVVG